jgi:hypothetical protein
MKYGSVVIYDGEGVAKAYAEDMPIFVLLGQDKYAPGGLVGYAEALEAAADDADYMGDTDLANDLYDQAKEVNAFLTTLKDWQAANPDRVKTPD